MSIVVEWITRDFAGNKIKSEMLPSVKPSSTKILSFWNTILRLGRPNSLILKDFLSFCPWAAVWMQKHGNQQAALWYLPAYAHHYKFKFCSFVTTLAVIVFLLIPKSFLNTLQIFHETEIAFFIPSKLIRLYFYSSCLDLIGTNVSWLIYLYWETEEFLIYVTALKVDYTFACTAFRFPMTY